MPIYRSHAQYIIFKLKIKENLGTFLLRNRKKGHDKYLQIFEKYVKWKTDLVIYATPVINKCELPHGRALLNSVKSSVEGKLCENLKSVFSFCWSREKKKHILDHLYDLYIGLYSCYKFLLCLKLHLFMMKLVPNEQEYIF